MKALIVASSVRADKLVAPLNAVGVEMVRVYDNGQDFRARLDWAGRVVRMALGERFDVIFSHEPGPICLLATLLGRMLGTPTVVRFRGNPWQEYEDLRSQGAVSERAARLGELCAEWSVRLADAVVPVSSVLGDAIHREANCPREKISSVPVPLDVERFSPVADRQALRREMGWDYEHIVSLALLFKYVQKVAGVERFLPVLHALVEQREDTAVVLAGDGQIRADFEARHRELLDHPRIIMPGWVDRIERLYQASDVFCHFSYFDANPNVIFEAWGCEVPVIVNDYPPLLEHMRDGETGFVLGNDADPAECLPIFERLLSDADYRDAMGRRAREHAIREYSFESIGHKLLALIPGC